MAHKNELTPRGARPTDLHLIVARHRERLGLSRAQLALRTGVAVRTIQRLERGKAMSADTILRVERALGLTGGTLVPGWRTTTSTLSDTVGARIREQRRAFGRTMTWVAAASGQSVATLSRLERGILGEVDQYDDRIPDSLVDACGFPSRQGFNDWIEGLREPPRPSK